MMVSIIPKRVKTTVAGSTVIGVILLLAYLSSAGFISITEYSGDVQCRGTSLDPCIALVNFTALRDFSVSGNWSFAMDQSVKQTTLFINDEPLGLSKSFEKGQNYTLKAVVLKRSPSDTIKWTFDIVDPKFLPAEKETIIYKNQTYGYYVDQKFTNHSCGPVLKNGSFPFCEELNGSYTRFYKELVFVEKYFSNESKEVIVQ